MSNKQGSSSLIRSESRKRAGLIQLKLRPVLLAANKNRNKRSKIAKIFWRSVVIFFFFLRGGLFISILSKINKNKMLLLLLKILCDKFQSAPSDTVKLIQKSVFRQTQIFYLIAEAYFEPRQTFTMKLKRVNFLRKKNPSQKVRLASKYASEQTREISNYHFWNKITGRLIKMNADENDFSKRTIIVEDNK